MTAGNHLQRLLAADRDLCINAVAADNLIEYGLNGLIVIHDQNKVSSVCHFDPPLQHCWIFL